MTEPRKPDALKKLVLFIIGLAIAATIIAFAWYFAVEIPARMVPLNSGTQERGLLFDYIWDFFCSIFPWC